MNKSGTVYAMLLSDPSGRLRRIGPGGDGAVIDATGKHFASIGSDGVVVRALKDGRVVARVADAASVAFVDDATAITGRFLQPAEHENDCERPTVLEELDLRTGGRRTLHRSTENLVVAAATKSSVLMHASKGDCEHTDVRILDRISEGIRTLAAGALMVSASAAADRFWIARPPDSEHANAWQEVLDRRGQRLGVTRFTGDAAYASSGHMVAYTQSRYGADGRALGSDLRLGTSHPRASDKALRLANEGDLVWDLSGRGIAMRRAAGPGGTDLEAVYCSVPALRCRRLPLRWHQDLDLMGIVSSSLLPDP